jgi:actin-related protein 5
MRMISQLAKHTKKEDNFGMRDEDWEVYKKISKVRQN